MDNAPRSNGAGVVASSVLALFALLLVAYLAAYLRLGRRHTVVQDSTSAETIAIIRSYDHAWCDDLYQPAAKVESWLLGTPVNAGRNPDVFHASYQSLP